MTAGGMAQTAVGVSSLRLLKISAALAGVWMLALAAIVIGFANPVELSSAQLNEADLIVTAQVRDANMVQVLNTWYGDAPDATLKVLNLPAVAAQVDEIARWKPSGTPALLLVLEKRPAGWRIVTLERQESPPLIYPLTADVQRQLEQYLQRRSVSTISRATGD